MSSKKIKVAAAAIWISQKGHFYAASGRIVIKFGTLVQNGTL